MESRNNKRELQLILNLVRLRQELSFAQMLLRGASISLTLIGLCNLIPQMILMIIFIELEEQLEELMELAAHYFSYMNTNSASLGI